MLTKKDTSSTDRRRLGLVPPIVLAGMGASVLMYWITDQGPGVSPDSTTYIEAARSLLAGNGFVVQGKAMTQFPPAYPLLLGLVGLFHRGDILLAARFLAALLFGANLVLLCLMVQVCTRHSLAATSCAMFVFLSSAPAVLIHSMAWSEPPFITFSMAAFLLLAHHIVRPTVSLLVLASLMAGIAAATRYVGVVLFPTMALALLLMGNRSSKHKMRDIIVFAGIASLPLASWFIRNAVIARNLAPEYEFAFHPFSVVHVKNLITTMHNFALPISISSWTKALHVAVAASLFLSGMALLHRRMYIRQNATAVGIVLPALCILYSLTYVVFLFISISSFSKYTPVDDRLLFPAFLALTVAAFALAWSLSQELGEQFVWYSFVFLVSFSVSINTNPAISTAVDIHDNGSGYTSRDWQRSEVISYLSKARDVRKIFTNGPEVIRFLTGKEVALIPAKEFPGARRNEIGKLVMELNENYEEQLSRMLRECGEGEALVAILNRETWRGGLPSFEEIESKGNVPVLLRTPDGVIYGTR